MPLSLANVLVYLRAQISMLDNFGSPYFQVKHCVQEILYLVSVTNFKKHYEALVQAAFSFLW